MDQNRLAIRLLDAKEDRALIHSALGWIHYQPRFFQDCDAVWGVDDIDEYLTRMATQADYGFFNDDELVGVITITTEQKGVCNSHLMTKRGADGLMITEAAAYILRYLGAIGTREVWSWLAAKNHGARQVVERIGMKLDGVTMLRGASHGMTLEWVRYSYGWA